MPSIGVVEEGANSPVDTSLFILNWDGEMSKIIPGNVGYMEMLNILHKCWTCYTMLDNRFAVKYGILLGNVE
ncbi:hypothetical protein CEXT_290571 [Caerostris extrusa]|uniref:Uncharacterized protein n=1 Tax=Caerostris extrusa TaxID=172846 RepID=A0AAV4Y1Z6_CAEEX|nr:hypothetical protein CEXT_290571 [Caerostris extrusa]